MAIMIIGNRSRRPPSITSSMMNRINLGKTNPKLRDRIAQAMVPIAMSL